MWVREIIIGLACVIVYYLYTKWKAFHEIWDYMEKVPGPKGIPVFGNLLELLGSLEHFFAKSVEWSLKYPGLFKMRTAYTRPTIWLYNPEDIEKITNNMTHISKGQLYELSHDWFGTGLVSSSDYQYGGIR